MAHHTAICRSSLKSAVSRSKVCRLNYIWTNYTINKWKKCTWQLWIFRFAFFLLFVDNFLKRRNHITQYYKPIWKILWNLKSKCHENLQVLIFSLENVINFRCFDSRLNVKRVRSDNLILILNHIVQYKYKILSAPNVGSHFCLFKLSKYLLFECCWIGIFRTRLKV